MKRGLLAIFLVLLVSSAAAQDLASPGITPGNPLYGLDRALENMQLGIAGQGVPKAKIYLLFGEERLAEAKYLADNNKPARLIEMVNDYEDDIAKAKQEVEKAKGIGLDVSSVQQQMEVARDKHIAVLELVLEKAPDSAKPGIQRAVDNAKEHSAQLKKENKKAGVFTDITGADIAQMTPEEIEAKIAELRQREDELKKQEEEQKTKGLQTITGYTVATDEQLKFILLKERMGIVFLITIIGTWLYFYYINHRRHKELIKKKKK